jgi:hypothetical protein
MAMTSKLLEKHPMELRQHLQFLQEIRQLRQLH